MSTLKEIIQDHKEYREQTIKMARTDLVRTYRASALGWSWAIIKPIVTIFIYWFAMTIGLRGGKPIGDYPYFLWLIDALVPWFYINDMLHRGTESMRKYSYLITKIRYPVSTIPTFVSISNMAVNLILLAVVFILHIVMGFPPTVYFLQIPLYILFTFMFFTSWSLFAGPLAAISQDFANLVKSFVFALLWVSGIFYDVNGIGNKYLRYILRLNPVTFICTGFRSSFMSESWFFDHPIRLVVFLTELLIMMRLALWSYKKLRKEIPDVL